MRRLDAAEEQAGLHGDGAGDGVDLRVGLGDDQGALAGCDLLTIAPDLLEKLSQAEGEIPRRLSPEIAKAHSIEVLNLNEKTFRWLHNEDAMATEKLAEGIRRFDADARKLEKLLTSLSAAVPAK